MWGRPAATPRQEHPADSDVPLPPNPLLEEEAKGHHHHHGGNAMETGNYPKGQNTDEQKNENKHEEIDSSFAEYLNSLRKLHPRKRYNPDYDAGLYDEYREGNSGRDQNNNSDKSNLVSEQDTSYADSVENGRQRNRIQNNLSSENGAGPQSVDEGQTRDGDSGRVSDLERDGAGDIKNRNRNKAFQAMNEQLNHGKKGSPVLPRPPAPTAVSSTTEPVSVATLTPVVTSAAATPGAGAGDRECENVHGCSGLLSVCWLVGTRYTVCSHSSKRFEKSGTLLLLNVMQLKVWL